MLACAGLVLLSSVFYLFPRMRSGAAEADLDRANLEWFRQREAELIRDGESGLREDARIRLLEEQHERKEQQIELQKDTARSFPVWVLLPLVAVLASALYYALGAAPDVLITQRLQGMQSDTTPEQMRTLIKDVETRSAQRPDNLHYLAMLGQFYMAEEDYGQAARTYDTLVDAVPGDAQALAYAAQAEYLANERTLGDRARLRAEQALAANPHQRTALGLLGMASFEQGQYRAAIEYWQRLVAMEPPGSESAQMIGQVIATARQQLAQEDPTSAASVAQQPAAAASTKGVTVTVTAPPGAAIAATDTVFILARNANSDSRMPIAVQRLSGAQLPVTLRLDDGNSMAGQKLSQTASVIVAVQVSASGQPGEANASWLGQVGPIAPSDDAEPQTIVLHSNTDSSE
ncbi:Formate-dependent nitrite reductase complex subunit NrfG [Halioglobus japonicus]|nr:Formate-dependent nitrite reductase complex subunit NrfG [Halioglobus japonicus]